MTSGTLERGAGGRPRRAVLGALLVVLVAATATPRADARLRLAAGSGTPASGGLLGRVPVRLDIRGDGRPHDVVVRSPGTLMAFGPGLQGRSAISARSDVACGGSWARPHLSSPPLAFTAVLHLEPGQSTWLQAVIDRWAPWPGFAVAFRPRVRGRYELVARHRRHTTQFADDASVCGAVFDVG